MDSDLSKISPTRLSLISVSAVLSSAALLSLSVLLIIQSNLSVNQINYFLEY